ncbi:pheromone-regulated multispanning membrane [Cordyceps militaris]|uniref:Plasma membrane fusion protein PRM1 n=1 Tax=Cordyceps militaris TaxID=73501 RepID=A0A2H4SWJ5_CORMI|nr:pheromone-regulated multispanning membrane [Cordyceps militaris]
MFSSQKHDDQASYPVVPPSLRSDPYETLDHPKTPDNRPVTHSKLTPYLGIRSQMSQIWINRWTILLLLVMVRVIILIAQLNDKVESAKAKALAACGKVEDVGSAMASMPHYLSAGVNSMAAKGMEEAVHGMITILDLIFQAVPVMIVFYINFLVGTYACLITAMVHGALDVVASVAKDATKVFNDVVDGATKEIKALSSDLENAINKVTGGIQKSIFGKIIPDIPKVDLTGPLDKLKGFDIKPDDFVKDVQQLNKDLPTFDDVQNLTTQAVSFPFKLVREALNKTYGDWHFKKDLFPLAQKKKMTFCSDNDTLNGFFQKLFNLIHKAQVIFLVSLGFLAILAMAPMAAFEMYRWKRRQKHCDLIERNRADTMDVAYIASRPLTAQVGVSLSSRLQGDRKILMRWCVAYATSPSALFVLSLALAGFFSCFCQFILIKAVQKEVPEITAKIGEFADEVVKTLEEVSYGWAKDANGVITGFNDDINKDVLGYVTNATDAVNSTINLFMDTLNTGLETVFNGTILLAPIKSVLHCVIGMKVEGVQKGLTWVHDHAHVNFPKFPNDVFSLGANESVSGDSDLRSFLASPSSVTTDEVSGAVSHVVNWLLKSVVQELLISSGIMLVYVIVVLIGVVRTLIGMATAGKGESQEDMRYIEQDQPPPPSPPSIGAGHGKFADSEDQGARWRSVPLHEKSEPYGRYGQGNSY